MTDEKKNISPDDEYQFPQDEYISHGDEQHAFGVDPSMESEGHGAADPAEAKQTKGKMDWLGLILDKVKQIKNKRMVLIAVGVVVLLFLFHLFSSFKTTSLPPMTTQTQTTDAAPVTPPVVASPQPSDNGMISSLDSLRAHSSRTSTDIRELQGQITDLQNSIQQSQAANQQLQKTVDTLAGQMNALTASVNQLAVNARSASKGEKPIVYHLRAILPDRAWITASTGETLSVTVGDRIEQYGTVSQIDPAHGLVQTSSGKKIEYGPNDF